MSGASIVRGDALALPLGDNTVERLVEQVDRLGRHLLDRHARLIVRRPLPGLPLLDVDAPIRVDDAGAVGDCPNIYVHHLECAT